MASITTGNSCDLKYTATTGLYEPISYIEDVRSWTRSTDYSAFIKTMYSDPESVNKTEEKPKKEPAIDHKFLEGFERVMKKDITMREKAAQLVDKVLVHGPALIVFWKDGSKTVVKCTNEEFDLEKGVAMAFIKRVFNNKGNYNAFISFIIDFWTF